MLVDKLRGAPVALQQDAKIIEPGYDALEFDAVHQEYSEWNLALSDRVQEGVLQVLFFVGRFFYSAS